ncbi:hypothetical protein, partial [Hyphomicrobium sp.]|uniref:hypothetical protein n=1 Tax=Hyphomicrobium sp. TaxID=82 RepID=UPI002BA657B2
AAVPRKSRRETDADGDFAAFRLGGACSASARAGSELAGWPMGSGFFIGTLFFAMQKPFEKGSRFAPDESDMLQKKSRP